MKKIRPICNHLKPTVQLNSIKCSVRTSQRTRAVFIIRTRKSVLFTEITGIYCDHVQHISTLFEQNAVFNVKTDSTYRNHCV
jgi:hypothetical protein